MEIEKYYKKLAKYRNANNFINQMYVSIQDSEQKFYEMSNDEVVIGMIEEILNAIEVAQLEKSQEIMELKNTFFNEYEDDDEEDNDFEMGFQGGIGLVDVCVNDNDNGEG